jgi:predicted PurR-regulated permease PerM
MRFVVPQVLAGVTAIAVRLNADGINLYFDNIVKFFADRFGETSTFAMTTKDFLDSARGSVLDFWNNMASKIDLSILTSDTGKKILGGVFGAVSSVLDFVVAFVIAINMLLSKEILQMQFKKIFYAFLKKDIVVRAFEILSKTNLIFRKYMVAILLDACIVGSITFIGCTILGVKYALLVGVMVGVTNIIPFFGPFIGGIPSALLILAQSPLLALYFVIFMLIVQQVDGNIFVPLIQGDATGLPAVWVLASVVIGGGVFGFWGLVCAVPVSAVLYMLFKETAENRLRKRNLPVDSVDYAEGAPHIDEEF